MKKQILKFRLQAIIACLLLCAVLFSSFTFKKYKTRYFFITYEFTTNNGMTIGSFFKESKMFPVLDSLKIDVIPCYSKTKIDKFIILSIFEFKNKDDYNRFKGNRSDPMINCDDAIFK